MSGWFADPAATERFVLGECRCPGQPHDEDFMDLRAELSGMDLAAMEQAEPAERMKLLIVDWNLHDRDGKVPIDGEHLGRLYVDLFQRIDEWLREHAKFSALPNAFAAPSQDSLRGSGSPIPMTQTNGSRMTPSQRHGGASTRKGSGSRRRSS